MSGLLSKLDAVLGPEWAAVLSQHGWAWLLAIVFGLMAGALVISLGSRRGREGDDGPNSSMSTQLAEIKGRLSAIAEMTLQRHAEQARAIDDRIDNLSRNLGQTLDSLTLRVGDNLAESGRRTLESLSSLNERLAVIETARQSLAELSSEVMSLQGVLANKQARGAFGQMRMETIVRDGLPVGAYEFQATLSNGKRPDCLVRLPNTPGSLVIDAKFPLEGFEALRAARTPEETKAAGQAIREAVGRHVEEIAEKYLISGETQDTALMFVPSESVYADLHERFPDLVQKAYRARVVIVAPNILMLAVQTVQAVIKDVKMRDQAGVIQREVGLLLSDVGRLAERVGELERHFGLSVKALEKISASADKIRKRGERVQSLDLEDAAEADEPPPRKRLSTRT
ncbi:MAG: DNA recombination protein RmuC [Hyphomicrobiaceae bacterium]|nr:MAG: DNA recombination protein RmuC [Hyphomicrobiaceae bacterium]